MLRICAVIAIVMFTGSAAADDEGSEHTAQLVGASSDTLGVSAAFDEKTGWQMTVRAKPGADEKTIKLPQIPKHHAHYLVYVTPGRKQIAWVEISAGATTKRTTLDAKDKLAWVYSPDGKLLRSFTYGQVLTKDEIAKHDRSVSHMMWSTEHKASAFGLEVKVAGSGKTRLLDVSTKTFR